MTGWSCLGSGNLNHLSLRVNHEQNVRAVIPPERARQTIRRERLQVGIDHIIGEAGARLGHGWRPSVGQLGEHWAEKTASPARSRIVCPAPPLGALQMWLIFRKGALVAFRRS